jgi:hypothetical protein
MGCKALILMHLSVKSHYFIRTEKMTLRETMSIKNKRV